ncbi:MAG: UDP-N-acetylmuramate dehydrogenase [Flaviflexus sp.]|nr:UDP-N-acetylmuramate dehydrogenase [Flaviflexus sp.]
MTCEISGVSEPIPVSPARPSMRRSGESFADLTTIGVGGPARAIVRAQSEEEIVAAVRECDESGEPVLLLGGGSNLLVADEGFAGTVVIDTRAKIGVIEESACGGALVRASGGTSWDEFVRFAISHSYRGIEALSGIPGTVGATPVQNVGAYGQEVSQTISSVRVYDRLTKRRTDLANAELDFGYRTSAIKRSTAQWGATGRWIVLGVTYQFGLGNLSEPIAYGQLATHLGTEVGKRVPQVDAREAVLDLRASKGMVLDDDDRDTYSCGSFFTNPVLEAGQVPSGAPVYPYGEKVKTSAAWLIDHAGCTKGFGGELTEGRASLSTRHTLAITNRGGASCDDVLTVARAVRDRVREAWGIELVNEPVILGHTL